jgi:hypothetical protein
MNDLAHYKQNGKLSLERFLNRIDISFRFHLSRFFDLNCGYYKSFLQRFILPKVDETGGWSVSEKPLLKMAMKFVEADKRKEERTRRKGGQTDLLRALFRRLLRSTDRASEVAGLLRGVDRVVWRRT